MVPTTPEPKIILMALTLNFLIRNKQIIKIPISMYFRLSKEKSKTPLRKIAKVKMDKPAPEIKDTTAGLKQPNTVCTPEKLRYL